MTIRCRQFVCVDIECQLFCQMSYLLHCTVFEFVRTQYNATMYTGLCTLHTKKKRLTEFKLLNRLCDTFGDKIVDFYVFICRKRNYILE